MKKKLFIYCTKAKPILFPRLKGRITYYDISNTALVLGVLNGSVVAECDYDVEEIKGLYDECYRNYCFENEDELLKNSCLEREDLGSYLKIYNNNDYMSVGYSIHIKNLNRFANPMELSDFFTPVNDDDRKRGLNNIKGFRIVPVYCSDHGSVVQSLKPLEVSPQNMQHIVYFNHETNQYEQAILISIRSPWVGKILNGEKTVEVRKKVLKEMVGD